MTARVARLNESDWRMFAGMRLRALTDSLGDDDPNYRQEVAFTAAQWRRRLRDHAQFAAIDDNRPVGLIGAQQENAETAYLYSLWLDHSARGRGLAHRLVTATLDWARGCGVSTVKLASPPTTRRRAPSTRDWASGSRRAKHIARNPKSRCQSLSVDSLFAQCKSIPL
jgi:GNAT superfamily N-acetyltransferase